MYKEVMEIPCGAERVSKHPEESKQILDKANKMEHGQWGQRSQPGTHMNWTPSVRGDNVSMDRRICRRAKEGAWSVGLETSARYAYELESPSVKEAAMIVWANKSV